MAKLTSTEGIDYRDRLVSRSQVWWKRLIPVQAPYRFNVRRLCPGLTLEIGCGIGRNLGHLGPGRAIGVDHNAASVATARANGLEAFEPQAFRESAAAAKATFDHLLCAHVAEHMAHDDFIALVSSYLLYLKPEGTFVVITPQEKGYATDPTHVRFVDFTAIRDDLQALGFVTTFLRSFPFPRCFGRFFPYNEFVVVGRRQPNA